MGLKKAAQSLCIALFASLTVACGAIAVPMALAFDDEADSNIGVTEIAFVMTLSANMLIGNEELSAVS
jgi:hypothetical protein